MGDAGVESDALSVERFGLGPFGPVLGVKPEPALALDDPPVTRSGITLAADPRGPETEREASEAPDLDSPAAGETRRHVFEHHLHRELDVAFDDVGLALCNPMDQLRPDHRRIVSLWRARMGLDRSPPEGAESGRRAA